MSFQVSPYNPASLQEIADPFEKSEKPALGLRLHQMFKRLIDICKYA